MKPQVTPLKVAGKASKWSAGGVAIALPVPQEARAQETCTLATLSSPYLTNAQHVDSGGCLQMYG